MADGKKATENGSPGNGDPREKDPLHNRQERFDPKVLDRSVIAVPLLREIERVRKEDGEEALAEHRFDVVIDLNLLHPGGVQGARQRLMSLLTPILRKMHARAGRSESVTASQVVRGEKSKHTPQYVFTSLTADEIHALVDRDQTERREHFEKECERALEKAEAEGPRDPSDESLEAPDIAIYRVWFDFPIEAHLDRSCATIKADAARIAFSAAGRGIVWAVVDSGIDKDHPHFRRHDNLNLKGLGLEHQDFVAMRDEDLERAPLRDEFGHGTHVAGILAGELDLEEKLDLEKKAEEVCWAAERERDHAGDKSVLVRPIRKIQGVAPEAKLLSLKVLDDDGTGGKSSDLIVALAYVMERNEYGRYLRVHGVNMSLGYPFDPEWFACGQSPLCVEVDRLVASGVVVVAAAGNHGYGWVSSAPDTKRSQTVSAGLDMTIQDPGNAARAITVGSAHREMPHVYGVSYFSSKGPTGDGRLKPDLVAPGERILSCASGKPRRDLSASASRDGAEIKVRYRQESGTSMAAPHVSGAIAAFLSIRREFIGRPDRVKEIFLQTATDLGRERYFQGHGLVDLMRAIQSI